MSMVASFLGMDMPEPVHEKGVSIRWDRSSKDPRKIVTTIKLDFAETDLGATEAGHLICRIAQMLRRPMKVKLDRIKRP